MAKRPNPAKLIKQRARKLKLHSCFVNEEWQETQIANVAIVRQHTNGNYTICFYLVDLMCLGVKDTFYMFNIDEAERSEVFEQFAGANDVDEIDYNLAHNIIFAGYEFALNCGIKPHKDFEKITKYMLEKDDENVPLIDVKVGENGIPHYVQNEEENESFVGKVIRTLEKNVGEGNFIVTRYDEFEEDFEDENLWEGMEDEGFDDFEDHDDLWEYLEEDDLDIEQVAFQFLEYFKEEELSENEGFKYKACFFLLMKHYTKNKRIEELIDCWETDMEVSPQFEFEQGLSEKTNHKINAIAQEEYTILSQKEKKILKENLRSQALADYIELEVSSFRVDVDNTESKDEEYDAYVERKEDLQKKHPDFPLLQLQASLADIKIEDFTIEKTFGKKYELSQFEFNEYIHLKFDTIVQKGDLNALTAFGAILENVAINEEHREGLRKVYDTFQDMMLLYRITEDYGGGF